MVTYLKPQSNGPLYSNMVIGTLAVDGWAVTFGTRGGAWAGCGPTQPPPHCTKCNSPPINGQCAVFILPLSSKGLKNTVGESRCRSLNVVADDWSSVHNPF